MAIMKNDVIITHTTFSIKMQIKPLPARTSVTTRGVQAFVVTVINWV
jgi:hypothetical protein